jgi:hypothetical protein
LWDCWLFGRHWDTSFVKHLTRPPLRRMLGSAGVLTRPAGCAEARALGHHQLPTASPLTHSLSQRSCTPLSLTRSHNAAALCLTHSLSQRSCSPLSHSLTHSHNAADTPLSHSLTLTTQLHSSLSLTHSRNAALLSLTCGVGAKLPGRARVLCAGVRASSAAAAAAAAG